MLSRRKAFRVGAQAAAALALVPLYHRRAEASILVNDIHSKLNATQVDRIVAIDSEAELKTALATARAEGKAVSVAGGRHAMGGQQFLSGGVLFDTRSMRRIIALDAQRGIVEAEAGIEWPDLIEGLVAMQAGQTKPWGSYRSRPAPTG